MLAFLRGIVTADTQLGMKRGQGRYVSVVTQKPDQAWLWRPGFLKW